MKRVEFGKRSHDYLLIPSIGILDMEAQFPISYFWHPYRFRIAFAWWNFRMSIGLGPHRHYELIGGSFDEVLDKFEQTLNEWESEGE